MFDIATSSFTEKNPILVSLKMNFKEAKQISETREKEIFHIVRVVSLFIEKLYETHEEIFYEYMCHVKLPKIYLLLSIKFKTSIKMFIEEAQVFLVDHCLYRL